MGKTVLSGVALALVLALAGPAVAQDEAAVSVGVDVVSDYVWRGQVRNDDGALQPWGCVEYSGFTFGLWGSMDLDDQPNDAQWEFTEVDVKASYAIPIGTYALDVGAVYYNYPNSDAESTYEIFGTFTFSDAVSYTHLTLPTN